MVNQLRYAAQYGYQLATDGREQGLYRALQGLVKDVRSKPNDTRYNTHLKIAEAVLKSCEDHTITDGRDELEKRIKQLEFDEAFDKNEITALQSSLKEKDLIIHGIEEGAKQWEEEYKDCRKILEQLVEAAGILYTYGSRIEGTYQKFPELLKSVKQFLSKYQHQ